MKILSLFSGIGAFEKAQAVPTSDTQLYKQAGNSIVVDVLVHIFEQLFKVINLESEEIEMKKNESKLIMAQTTKMFDLDKLVDKNPDLFNELCEKYPLKKECVYMIKYQKEEVAATIEEVIKDYVENDVKVTQELIEKVELDEINGENSDDEGETYYLHHEGGMWVSCAEHEVDAYLNEGYILVTEEEFNRGELNDADDEAIDYSKYIDENDKVEYPEDFLPLYSIGEKVTIKYNYDEIIEHLEIRGIIPKLDDAGKIVDYYYEYLVVETGEVKVMGEPWLTEHEVLV